MTSFGLPCRLPFHDTRWERYHIFISHKILVSFLIFSVLQGVSFGGVFFQITFLPNLCLIKNLLTRSFYSASTTILRCEQRSHLFFNPLHSGIWCLCGYSSTLTLCSFCLLGSSNLAEFGLQSPRYTSGLTGQMEPSYSVCSRALRHVWSS